MSSLTFHEYNPFLERIVVPYKLCRFSHFPPSLRYLTDTSLKYLVMTKLPTLEDLEVSDNGTVTDDGVVYLRKMETLRRLRLQNLPGVDDPQMVIGR